MYGYHYDKNDVGHCWDWKSYSIIFFIDDSQNNLKKNSVTSKDNLSVLKSLYSCCSCSDKSI